jgi:hypothetical protein
MLQKTPTQLQGVIEGIAHVVVDAPDLARSKSFYESVLGLRSVGSDVMPTANGSRGETLILPSGQLVTLAGTKPLNDLSVSPAHQAYTVTPQTRDKIVPVWQRKASPCIGSTRIGPRKRTTTITSTIRQAIASSLSRGRLAAAVRMPSITSPSKPTTSIGRVNSTAHG